MAQSVAYGAYIRNQMVVMISDYISNYLQHTLIWTVSMVLTYQPLELNKVTLISLFEFDVLPTFQQHKTISFRTRIQLPGFHQVKFKTLFSHF